MATTARRAMLRSALQVWAPDWPRRVTRHQSWAIGPEEARDQLLYAEDAEGNSPFISTYSFPRGHTNENEIPEINTLFIDFDFEDGDYVAGSGNVDAWRRDLSHLLVRVRMVARYLVQNRRPGWRAALSGHKGIHLFLDFPSLSSELGDFAQYTAGMSEYADDLVTHIAAETGISDLDDYVDVTSSDLGRLCRVPNTKHETATASFDEARYCVPVTIDELADLGVDDYIVKTQQPQPLPWSGREENERVNEILSQYITTATVGRSRTYSGSTVDRSRVSTYREESNENISLSDIEFLTTDRPCVWRYYGRDDKFRHGYQSHYMEMFVIRELIEHNVPIDVIKDFFNSAPEYDEQYTENRIEEIISRDYKRFSVESVLRNAREFCGYDDCKLCQQAIAEHDNL
jgi:hypothetical protein